MVCGLVSAGFLVQTAPARSFDADGTGPHPLPTTQCEGTGTLWVVGRGCGPAPTEPGKTGPVPSEHSTTKRALASICEGSFASETIAAADAAGVNRRLVGRARIAGIARVARIARVQGRAGVARIAGVRSRARVAGIARVAGVRSRARVARIARVAGCDGIDGSAGGGRGILANTLYGVATGQCNGAAQNEAGRSNGPDGGAGKKSTVLFTHIFIPPRDLQN